MRGRGVRIGSAAAAMALTAGTALLIPASASAATDSIVVGNCATSIQGAPGQPVALSTAAVTGTITDLISAVPLLGPPLATPFQQAFNALPPIPLGSIPSGQGNISGASISDAVVTQLNNIPLLGPIIGTLAGTVRQTLAAGCNIALSGVNAVVAPVQNGVKALAPVSQPSTPTKPSGPPPSRPSTGTPASPATPPGGGGSTSNTSLAASSATTSEQGAGFFPYYGRVPLFSYVNLPFAIPGRFAPSPGSLYGEQGVPGGTQNSAANSDVSPEVSTAGNAQALPVNSVSQIATPVFLAVLALAAAVALFVRALIFIGFGKTRA